MLVICFFKLETNTSFQARTVGKISPPFTKAQVIRGLGKRQSGFDTRLCDDLDEIHFVVFWALTPCSEDGGSTALRNVGNLPHHYALP